MVLMSSVYSLASARSRAIDLSREHSHWRGRESRIGGVHPLFACIRVRVGAGRIHHAFSIFASTSILPVQHSLDPCTVNVLIRLASNQTVDLAGMPRCIPSDKLNSRDVVLQHCAMSDCVSSHDPISTTMKQKGTRSILSTAPRYIAAYKRGRFTNH